MRGDEPFPLEAIPSRVRSAILQEFKGRLPSVREVDLVSDKQWLATPGVGPSALVSIRSITAGWQDASPPSSRMTDAELLERLEFVQRELRAISKMLKKGWQQIPYERSHPESASDVLQNSDA
jgi:hypothetical protein